MKYLHLYFEKNIVFQFWVVRQARVGKVAKSFHVQESEAKPALFAAVVPKWLCSHIQLK